MAQNIGAEIRRARKAAGISAEHLADLCTEHGLPIKRHVITGLEIGRRDNVSVAEVVAIATVLNVPVATLIYPVVEKPLGQAPTWLGQQGAAIEGSDWFTGHMGLSRAREIGSIGLVDSDDAAEASRRSWYAFGLGNSLRAFLSRLQHNLNLLDEQFLSSSAEASDEDEFTFSQTSAALAKVVDVHARLIGNGAELAPVSEMFDLRELLDRLNTLPPTASPGIENAAQSLIEDVSAVINSEES